MRVLVAEDDSATRSVLAGMLKKKGHDVVEAANGLEAWLSLQQPEAPMLAILDWIMPEMDGLDLLRRIRSIQTEQPIYIIMLTIKGEKTNIITGLQAGADDYLPKPFDYGELCARVEVGLRVTEMRVKLLEARNALAHEAAHDPLTGMLNRRAILNHLHKELSRASRHGDLLVIGMFDIDHFKKVNDTYGHKAGDEILIGLSHILSGSIREYDSLGRIGGEEFLMITPMKPGTEPELLFNRLCNIVSESRINTKSGVLSITVSIGVAYANTKSTVDGLLESADAALYRAKSEGRNRYCIADFSTTK
ncbi:MAG: diguanylate cyclase response regulator [Desulfobacterales bacterium CG23_combo_of_CG06-09_8_20_14_all_51_8]|nr:MAG: diguanylate cyclase response regulator [Desulfobacterales bacterium CG23_combo_of_CG06-09_8_20_14_all_51_8]